MRVKYKDVDIECTVDEFEEMVVRGLFGEKPKFDPSDFEKKWNELQDKPNKERPADSPFDVVMVYGVHLPNGGFQPVWPNKTTTGQDLTYTADNHTSTTIEPTQADSTKATINLEAINGDDGRDKMKKVGNLDWNELTKAK